MRPRVATTVRGGCIRIKNEAIRLGMAPKRALAAVGFLTAASLSDRLLLGMKGTMSEMELSVLRQRSLEALKQKGASRRAVGLTASPRGVWARGRAGIGLSFWRGRASGVRSPFSRKEIPNVTVAYADDRRHEAGGFIAGNASHLH